MPARRHVALLIETSHSYGRGLLRGVKSYMDQHASWSIFVERHDLRWRVPQWLNGWRGDGILVRSETPAIANTVRASGVPAVELRHAKSQHTLPYVGLDNHDAGRLVARYFIDRGLRELGCYTISCSDYYYFCKPRRDAFVQTAEAAGLSCRVFDQPARRESPRDWQEQQQELAEWVEGLPKPVGVLACTDQLGFWLLDACDDAGVAVPEKVSVVGVENDDVLCALTTPPLSSVHCNDEMVGYEAARLLEGLMSGESPPPNPILVPPLEVVTRRSSDAIATGDRLVARAAEVIQERFRTGISVDDVVRTAGTSRSALERRMRAALGRSPRAEILRVQLEHVKQQLADTELTLDRIAWGAGFKHPQYMCETFKKHFGMTPGQYRAQSRTTRDGPGITGCNGGGGAYDRRWVAVLV